MKQVYVEAGARPATVAVSTPRAMLSAPVLTPWSPQAPPKATHLAE